MNREQRHAHRQHLQDDHKLSEMLFYTGKCKCILTGHGNEDRNLDLGLTISADIKVSGQCGIAALKGNQFFGLIRRNIVHKEKELIICCTK